MWNDVYKLFCHLSCSGIYDKVHFPSATLVFIECVCSETRDREEKERLYFSYVQILTFLKAHKSLCRIR